MTHYTTLVQRCRATNSLLADEIDAEFRRVDQGPAPRWKPITEAPYRGEPFLAAIEVHNAHTKAFSHFEYAILYMDEGKPRFYDDGSETGWAASDYTLCLAFPILSKSVGVLVAL